MKTSDYIDYMPRAERHERIVFMLQNHVKTFLVHMEMAVQGLKDSGNLTASSFVEMAALNADSRVAKRLILGIMTNETITSNQNPTGDDTHEQHVDKHNIRRINILLSEMADDTETEPSEIAIAQHVREMFNNLLTGR